MLTLSCWPECNYGGMGREFRLSCFFQTNGAAQWAESKQNWHWLNWERFVRYGVVDMILIRDLNNWFALWLQVPNFLICWRENVLPVWDISSLFSPLILRKSITRLVDLISSTPRRWSPSDMISLGINAGHSVNMCSSAKHIKSKKQVSVTGFEYVQT